MGRPSPSPRSTAAAAARSKELAAPPTESIDRLVHEPVRLGIMSALAASRTLSFSELRRLLRTTDGNLSVHARKLEDAGLIAADKSFVERVPHTEYRLTAAGRKRLERYLRHLEAVIRNARSS